jgi:3-phosphoshikimate 1-carboxyvinyltransferase
MKKIVINPAIKLSGEIAVPGDKSISHRAVMLGALANGETVIHGFLPSEDCLATIDCFREMGIEIDHRPQTTDHRPTEIIIKGRGLHGLQQPKGVLDVGNSGTTMRLMLGILAGQDFLVEITGDASIQKRPMLRVAKPLRKMGADIEGEEKSKSRISEIYAPIKIHGGKLKAIEYTLPVASAQVKSAILLAGLFAEGKTVVIEKHPSRDHTERMFEFFGASNKGFEGKEIDVPGDISSAAFFMVAGLLVPEANLTIHKVGLNPTRTGILDVLHRMGANITVEDEQIISNEPRGTINVQHPTSNIQRPIRGIKIDGEIIPRIIDEIPIIAVAATQAEGITEIRGARELRVKESDRIATLAAELRKMGADIKELDDGMLIEGPTKLKGAHVKSYGDHRIAMSLAIAGLAAEGETVIDDTACIETSFPGFEKLLGKIKID